MKYKFFVTVQVVNLLRAHLPVHIRILPRITRISRMKRIFIRDIREISAVKKYGRINKAGGGELLQFFIMKYKFFINEYVFGGKLNIFSYFPMEISQKVLKKCFFSVKSKFLRATELKNASFQQEILRVHA